MQKKPFSASAKKAKAGDKDAKAEMEVLEKVKAHLEQGLTLRQLELSPEEKALVSYMNFLTIKPTMYIANVLEDGFENNPHLDVVRDIAGQRRRYRSSGLCCY